MFEPTVTEEQSKELDNLFSYHKPFGNQSERYEAIWSKAKDLAQVILSATPKSADQSASIRKLRESVMTANAAIAVNEQEPKEAVPA